MNHENRGELVELGLSPTEAQVYLALLQNASLSASALAGATELSRSRVYQTLCSLADKGLVESGAGYGSKFVVVAPDQAFPALIARERETLTHREDLAGRVGQRLSALVEPGETAPEGLIQILRNPKVINDRFDRLQLEAERNVDRFIKAPIVNPANANPAQQKAQRRGVRYRCLYERAVLHDPAVEPHLAEWIAAGEQARVYDGELPHRLAIFDRQKILMPLLTPGGQGTTLFIRHPQLATSLDMFFETLWERAEPVIPGNRRTAKIPRRLPQLKSKSKKTAPIVVAPSGNHRRNDKSPVA